MRFLIALLFPLWSIATEPPIHIIPEPADMSVRDGHYKISADNKVVMATSDSAFQEITAMFMQEFFGQTGLKMTVTDTAQKIKSAYVRIEQNNSLPAEGYSIEVTPARIHLAAADAAGLFYAFQTFRQLLPAQYYAPKKMKGQKWSVPCVTINDYPRFKYRGMHLDVSRHFYSIDFLKRYLDILSFYKINTFHWHLTDSHGWRLEIKKYPRLTSVGAWRADRTGMPFTIAPPTGEDEKATYGGFYSQDEVRELIGYAKKRHITIIPEIEMPGHCTAALVAYPQFTCLNNPVPLRIPCGYPGDLKHNFCPGNDSTFLFLQDILDEVIALFPSEYIHIGGDEVRPASWLACPRCQKRMSEEKIADAKGLQSYFTNRIDRYITSKKRKLIGWDEILEGGISQNAAVMSWRGNEGGIAAAKDSHYVVMAPYRFVYFDFYQSPPALEPDISYAGLTLQQVYNFEPVPTQLEENEINYIMGGQACLWTENIRTTDRVEYMLLPRLFALSESLWSPPANKYYPKFVNKTIAHFKMLEHRGINYAKSIYNVSIDPVFDSSSRTVTVSLNAQTGSKYIIRYCTATNDPSCLDPIYTGPFAVKENANIRAALFNEDTLLGKINTEKISIHKGLGGATATEQKRLADGIHGTIEPYDGRWVFWQDSVVNVNLDMGDAKPIRSISFRCLEDMVGNALLPEAITVSVSADGRNYSTVYSITNDKIPQQQTRHIVEYKKDGLNESARYVKLTMRAPKHVNTENPSPNTMFMDELVVD